MRSASRTETARQSLLAAAFGVVAFFPAHAGGELSFGGPDVLKMDWGTRSLRVADLNGDGRNDLALINNDTAQIEVVYQLAEGEPGVASKVRLNRNRWDPLLEDARFEGESITTGFSMFDLTVGDLNGDGRADLAYTSREMPLTVRLQTEAGDWAETLEFDNFEALGWPETLTSADLDADGSAELVVISADALRIFSYDEAGGLGEPEIYYVTGDNPFNLRVEDVTGDGRKDVLYITSSGKQSLALREQFADGKLGPEQRFIFERPVQSVRILPPGAGGDVSFAAVNSRSGGLEFFRLEAESAKAEVEGFPMAQPEVYPLFKKGRQSASSTMSDVDGDGVKDLLVANPAKAELVLFRKGAGRFEPPQVFPSFSEVSSIAGGRFFESTGDAVVVLSTAEKNVGVSRMDASGRLSFPRQIQFDGDPVVCEAVDLDADDFAELALVLEREGGARVLLLAKPVDRADPQAGWEVLSTTELEGVRRRPSAVRSIDIFGHGRPGLMVFVQREAPVLLAPMEGDVSTLHEVAAQSGVRESLLKGVSRAQVSVFDVNGDGGNELVVGRAGYARALRFTEGQLEMVDQFNARRGEEMVSAVVPVFDSGALASLVLYVAEAGEFQFLERDADGVFRYRSSAEAGKIDLLHWTRTADPSGSTEYVFAGEDRFWYLPVRAEQSALSVTGTHETELEDVHYSHVDGADFDGDGRLDLVAVDGKEHVVEILSEGDEGWGSLMYWKVFEQNMHYQGRTGGSHEPRQVVIADLTDDEKLDFAFLVHDRILFYPQE